MVAADELLLFAEVEAVDLDESTSHFDTLSYMRIPLA